MLVNHGCIKHLWVIFIIMIFTNAKAEELIEAQGQILNKENLVYAPVEKTRNKNRAAQSELFRDNVYRLIKIDHQKVLFMCKEQQYGFPKRFGINTDNGWTCDFIIGVNEKFRGPLDNHGSIDYELVSIGDESITLRYESRFSHMSFGKNKVTIDEGTVEINYRR